MMTSDDKVGGWVKKGQNHDDVILECPQSKIQLGEGGWCKNGGAFTLTYFRNESYFSKCLF